MKRIVLVIGIVLLFAVAAYAFEISAGPTYQDMEISGKVRSNIISGTNIDIDIKNDLKISDDDAAGVNVTLIVGKHQISADLASFEFSGANNLTRNVTFKGQTYTAGTYVQSKIKYDLYEVQYQNNLIDLGISDIGITLGPVFKVSVYEASVQLQGGGNNEKYEETLPVPSIGLAAGVELTKFLSASAQATGVGYSGDTYIEYKALLCIKPIESLSFDIGYKGIDLDFSDGNDLLDLESNGPYFRGAFVYKF